MLRVQTRRSNRAKNKIKKKGETPMTPFILRTAQVAKRIAELIAPTLHAIGRRMQHAFEALAEAKMRQAHAEIERYRRRVEPQANAPVKASPASR
jgi:hypothetical protein